MLLALRLRKAIQTRPRLPDLVRGLGTQRFDLCIDGGEFALEALALLAGTIQHGLPVLERRRALSERFFLLIQPRALALQFTCIALDPDAHLLGQ